MNRHLSRRYFIKLSLATLSGFSLDPFIKGCTPNQTIIEAPETGAKELESHPAIPTPSGQCYLGWHHDIGYRISGASEYWLKKKSARAEEQILRIYKNKIGALPAVHSIADDFLGGSYYPKGVLEAAVKNRYSSKWFERAYEAVETLPMYKLVVFYDYRWLNLGLENQLFQKRNIKMIQKIGKKSII